MPTILSVLGLPKPVTDGESYLDSMLNDTKFKDYAYTSMFNTHGKKSLETRAYHDSSFCYIRNFWSNGVTTFDEDGSLDNQPTVRAIRNADPVLYKKLKIRTPEEFYDLQLDPFCQANIVEDKNYKNQLSAIKRKMMKVAVKHKDENVRNDLKKAIMP